jgi:hypothetical protein
VLLVSPVVDKLSRFPCLFYDISLGDSVQYLRDMENLQVGA